MKDRSKNFRYVGLLLRNKNYNDYHSKKHKPYGLYEIFVKRIIDFAVSITTLILFAPLLAVVGLLVKINLGSPVLFVQERPGKNERKVQYGLMVCRSYFFFN